MTTNIFSLERDTFEELKEQLRLKELIENSRKKREEQMRPYRNKRKRRNELAKKSRKQNRGK
jgi:hypothetical protein